MGYPNRSEKTDRWGNPPMQQTLSQLMSSSMGSNPGSAPNTYPSNIPGTQGTSSLIGKNQTPFVADNPYQFGYASDPHNPNAGLDAINRNVSAPFVDDGSITPLSSKTIVGNGNMVWDGTKMVPAGSRPPVSLTVTGGNHAYNNPGWGAGTIPPWMPQGADPGMGGLPGYGNTQLASGIPPQGPPPPGIAPTVWAGDTAQQQPSAGGYSLAKRPGLPMSGQVGFQHNGSSNEPAAYSSGGYLFDRNGAQIGRDPNFTKQLPYAGTADAVAAAQARDRLTAGTMPQQNALQSMGVEQWLQRHPEVNPASMRRGNGGGGSNSMSGAGFGARALKGK